MKIGCDLDGVLASSEDEIVKRVAREFKLELSIDDFAYGFDGLDERFGIDATTFLYKKVYTDEWFWAKAQPYEDNISALADWKSQGHEIHIITGRKQSDTALVTRGWLKRFGVPYDYVVFEPVMHKINYIKNHELSVMFEDRFFEANKIGAFGIRSFIVKRPWNQEYQSRVTNPLITYIDSLTDANDFIGGNYA